MKMKTKMNVKATGHIVRKEEAIDDKSKHDNIQRGLDSKRQD